MNTTVNKTSHLWPLAPALQSIVTARGGPANCEAFELEDTVLRAGGYAWDIGEEAAPILAEIARLNAEKEAADAEARAQAEAEEAARPWRVSKDTIIGRVYAAGKLPEVISALASQTAEQQFLWAHSAWFWSNNETLRGMCAFLELNAEEIMARDPYL